MLPPWAEGGNGGCGGDGGDSSAFIIGVIVGEDGKAAIRGGSIGICRSNANLRINDIAS
jgi:Pyruvate/2-oxoacid:ferredoxin oxidoreductase gamma subunit